MLKKYKIFLPLSFFLILSLMFPMMTKAESFTLLSASGWANAIAQTENMSDQETHTCSALYGCYLVASALVIDPDRGLVWAEASGGIYASLTHDTLDVTGRTWAHGDYLGAGVSCLAAIEVNLSFILDNVGQASLDMDQNDGGVAVGLSLDNAWIPFHWNSSTKKMGATLNPGTYTIRALAYAVGGDPGFLSFSYHVYTPDSSPVLEPTAMLFLGFGLLGLIGFRRKFMK